MHLTIDQMLLNMFNRNDRYVEMWYNTYHPYLKAVPQELMKTPEGFQTVHAYLCSAVSRGA